jgi:CubicO group peptidase (beta-lactamase class C family)
MYDQPASAAPGDRTRRPRPRRVLQGLLAATATAVAATVALFLTAAPAPATPTTGSTLVNGTVAEQVDRYLTTQLGQSAIPGTAVALTRGNQVLMVRGYGHNSDGTAVTANSPFRVASLSKSFTALAVMQLVDAGRVNLDDPVRQHVPEFQMADPRADRITIRQLLDQTSGISDAVVPDLSRRQPTSPEDATTSLRSAHLASDPGTKWSYANPNYQVAARLVEVVTGQEFGQYLRQHIFDPAHMTSTTSTTTDRQHVPGLADGHVTAYGHAVAAPGFGSYVVGDGGIVSTATDMAQWLIVNTHNGQAADGTPVVSSRGLRLLHTPSAPRVGYALGWSTRGPRSAPTRLEHSGSLFTFTSEQAMWPGTGYGVVLLFNSGSPMVLDQTAIAHGVFDIIEGTTPRASTSPTTTPDLVLSALSLLALVLGSVGVVRARSWARRRRGGRVSTTLRVVPAVLVLAVGAAFPLVAEALIGRDATWRAVAYEWPALLVFVGAAALSAAATLGARAWAWRTARRAARDHTTPHPGSVEAVTSANVAETTQKAVAATTP